MHTQLINYNSHLIVYRCKYLFIVLKPGTNVGKGVFI